MSQTTETVAAKPAPPFPAGEAKPRTSATSLLSRLLGVLPSLAALLSLGGLGYWGHHNGWAFPKFSSLTGAASPDAKDWCEAHNVPESVCVECKPDLFPKDSPLPWCKVHGVPECPLDHPEIAEVREPRHFPRYDVLAALNSLDRPENSQKCKLHLRRLQFATAAAADKAGVDVEVVQEQEMAEYITANGEITFDPTRVARLSTPVPGRISLADKVIGEPVHKGDILALVDAAEVGKAKAEFLQALALFHLKRDTLGRMRPFSAESAMPEIKIREMDAALQEARIRLAGAQQALVNLGLPVQAEDLEKLTHDEAARHIQFLGLPRALAKDLNPRETTANLFPLKSPLDGVIIAREVVAGERVDASKTLFVVADPRRLSLTLNVRLEDAKYLALGQTIRFRPTGSSEDAVSSVAWIANAVDEKTRTVKVRGELANTAGRIRANTFGPGRIVLREEKNAVAVPKEAVHWDGDCFIVFVRDRDYLTENSPKIFHVRKVRPGARDERHIEILAGVLPGEWVAARGSTVLQAELLKGNLGVG